MTEKKHLKCNKCGGLDMNVPFVDLEVEKATCETCSCKFCNCEKCNAKCDGCCGKDCPCEQKCCP
jgi:hypothetical protein